MITTDKIADGKLLTLPPEAGDVNAPRFQPNDAWLRQAPPDQQKTAMWRWFATRYEEPSLIRKPHRTTSKASSISPTAGRVWPTRCCTSASTAACRARWSTSWSRAFRPKRATNGC